MTIENNLKFKDSHEWIIIGDDGILTVGISNYAQESLGDIVYLELPSVGKIVNANETAAVIESVKAASDIYAPASGEIIEINHELAGTPEIINTAPYKSWLFKIRPSNISEFDDFLTSEQYHSSVK